jgi:hypothetical protein
MGLDRRGVTSALAGDEVARCATMPRAHESYALAPALHGRVRGLKEAQARISGLAQQLADADRLQATLAQAVDQPGRDARHALGFETAVV